MIVESKYDFDLDIVNTNSLSLIINQIKRGSTILEFGPANGRMTKYLKEALDCKVYLVEIDEAAGKEALQYGEELVVDDIETYSWYEKYENIRFDYITFADVLEHLREPEQVLARAKSLLKQDGSILLSVPNLAHNSVIISLLNHEFEYNKTGLLDNTHIHFFTKNSLENVMNRTGLTVVKRFATYAPTGTTEIAVHNEDVRGIDPSFWKTRKYGEIYQYVYEAKKGPEFVGVMENFLSDGFWHYYARLFFDRGDGFREDDLISKVIRDIEGNIVFEAAIPEDVKMIRFVPFDDLCMVEPIAFTDIVDGEEHSLHVIRTNEVAKFENKCMFGKEVPYFDFVPEPGKKFHNIRLIYKVVYTDKTYLNNLNGIWEKYREEMDAIMLEHDAMSAENVRLNEVNYALTGQIAHLENQIQAMKGTFVWRTAERFRRLRNKLLKR